MTRWTAADIASLKARRDDPERQYFDGLPNHGERPKPSPEAPRQRQRAGKDYGAMVDLAFATAGLPKPDREVKFSPTRKFRLDYGVESLKIGCEVDGATWIPGRGHSSGSGILRDMDKANTWTALGWRVFRLTPEGIKKGELIGWLACLKQTEAYNTD